MEGRFQLLTQKDIDSLSEKAKNDNTSKSTKTWINQFKSWAEKKKKDKWKWQGLRKRFQKLSNAIDTSNGPNEEHVASGSNKETHSIFCTVTINLQQITK